jgi:Domain of unknown function (DUF4349)
MMNELVLQDLLARTAEEIPVPVHGPQRVLDSIDASTPYRPSTARLPRVLLVAAAVVVIGGLSLLIATGGSRSESKSASVETAGPASRADQNRGLYGGPAGVPKQKVAATPTTIASATSGTAPAAPVDGAKIVKTGTLDLRAPHGGLRVTVNRVSGTAVGLGGYVATSRTSYGGTDPTAEVTIRVPVDSFETAIGRLRELPGVTLLSDSENGTDVTAQYADLQAQLRAASTERDALLVVLSQAQSIGDILAVRDRVTAVETEIDQLQGRINVLGDQAAFSSLAVTLSEKAAHVRPVAHAKPSHGLAKAWDDARQGFTNSVEWLLARSGGALIVLLTALALLFGIRYLYPIVRRGLI